MSDEALPDDTQHLQKLLAEMQDALTCYIDTARRFQRMEEHATAALNGKIARKDFARRMDAIEDAAEAALLRGIPDLGFIDRYLSVSNVKYALGMYKLGVIFQNEAFDASEDELDEETFAKKVAGGLEFQQWGCELLAEEFARVRNEISRKLEGKPARIPVWKRVESELWFAGEVDRSVRPDADRLILALDQFQAAVWATVVTLPPEWRVDDVRDVVRELNGLTKLVEFRSANKRHIAAPAPGRRRLRW